MNIINTFCDRTICDIWEQLGNLDERFLIAKVIPEEPLSSLGPLDGNVIVVLRVSCHFHMYYHSRPLRRRPSLLKRKRPVTDEPISHRLKRKKFITTTPSVVATGTGFESLQQNPSEKILDDRPCPDPDIPPIPLPAKITPRIHSSSP